MNSERQNNNKKIQKNAFKQSYKLICIVMSQIGLKHDLVLVGNHRGQRFLVVGHQVSGVS